MLTDREHTRGSWPLAAKNKPPTRTIGRQYSAERKDIKEK